MSRAAESRLKRTGNFQIDCRKISRRTGKYSVFASDVCLLGDSVAKRFSAPQRRAFSQNQARIRNFDSKIRAFVFYYCLLLAVDRSLTDFCNTIWGKTDIKRLNLRGDRAQKSRRGSRVRGHHWTARLPNSTMGAAVTITARHLCPLHPSHGEDHAPCHGMLGDCER